MTLTVLQFYQLCLPPNGSRYSGSLGIHELFILFLDFLGGKNSFFTLNVINIDNKYACMYLYIKQRWIHLNIYSVQKMWTKQLQSTRARQCHVQHDKEKLTLTLSKKSTRTNMTLCITLFTVHIN